MERVGCSTSGAGPGFWPSRSHPWSVRPSAWILMPTCSPRRRGTPSSEAVANIRWVQDLAEQIPELDLGLFRLVTFGQSFHRTDRERVAEAVYELLEPGGSVALVAHTADDRSEPPGPGRPRIPHHEIRSLIDRYLGSRRRAARVSSSLPLTVGRTPWAGPASAAGVRSSLPDGRTSSRTPTASWPTTCRCRLLPPTSSPTDCPVSRATSGRFWRSGLRRVFSGIGPATPRSSSPRSPASPLATEDLTWPPRLDLVAGARHCRQLLSVPVTNGRGSRSRLEARTAGCARAKRPHSEEPKRCQTTS